MRSDVIGFDWDRGNRGKCQKHGVGLVAIESLFEGPVAIFPDQTHSGEEERLKAIGRSRAGRHILIVFTLRMRGSARLIRPISARYMHQKEIDHYEQEAANPDNR